MPSRHGQPNGAGFRLTFGFCLRLLECCIGSNPGANQIGLHATSDVNNLDVTDSFFHGSHLYAAIVISGGMQVNIQGNVLEGFGGPGACPVHTPVSCDRACRHTVSVVSSGTQCHCHCNCRSHHIVIAIVAAIVINSVLGLTISANYFEGDDENAGQWATHAGLLTACTDIVLNGRGPDPGQPDCNAADCWVRRS
eukprot:SAG22_NODE_3498_length_1680_cov_1.380139_3_plen_195_part_00